MLSQVVILTLHFSEKEINTIQEFKKKSEYQEAFKNFGNSEIIENLDFQRNIFDITQRFIWALPLNMMRLIVPLRNATSERTCSLATVIYACVVPYLYKAAKNGGL